MRPTPAPAHRAGAAAPARPRHQPDAVPARRHLRPVPDTRTRPERPSTRRRLRPQAALALALGAFFLILFGVALLQTVLVQGQIHLDGLRADVAERQTEARTLRADVAAAESPAQLIEAARGLGLVPPDQTNYVLQPPGEGTAAP